MKNEEINESIAALLGWDFKPSECNGWVYPGVWCRNPEGKLQFRHSIPDFCLDLNAMHEAESAIRHPGLALWCDYTRSLRRICGDSLCAEVHATARQRAEAFLRTIGKWKEGE